MTPITAAIAQCVPTHACRGTEAETWASRARSFYGRAAGLNVAPIEKTMGAQDVLKQGGGGAGSGVVLNLTLRRALPMLPPDA